ncbi:hypothetical protein G3M58_30810, partial [Streptomyces sp. SID7499]|nr:hypothetical protein [Streptomyces sp. SID7499]
GRDTFEAGRTAPAVDVGNAGRVYDPTGSRAWIITVVLVVLAYVLLVVVARRHLMPPPSPGDGGRRRFLGPWGTPGTSAKGTP